MFHMPLLTLIMITVIDTVQPFCPSNNVFVSSWQFWLFETASYTTSIIIYKLYFAMAVANIKHTNIIALFLL